MIFALALAAQVIPAGQSFDCTPTAVWDGDGPVWCSEGPRVRLAGIAAREIDGSCSPGHPCPGATAAAARDRLAKLVGEHRGTNRTGHILVQGPTMACMSRGGAGGDRTAAFCTSPRGGDLSCAMLRSGTVVRWDKYWKGHVCE